MELQRLKGDTVDGHGLNVSPDQALEIITSLASQLLHGINTGRKEWGSVKGSGAGYFSIFVVPEEEEVKP